MCLPFHPLSSTPTFRRVYYCIFCWETYTIKNFIAIRRCRVNYSTVSISREAYIIRKRHRTVATVYCDVIASFPWKFPLTVQYDTAENENFFFYTHMIYDRFAIYKITFRMMAVRRRRRWRSRIGLFIFLADNGTTEFART